VNATSHRMARCPNSDAAVTDDSMPYDASGYAKCPRCGREIAVRFSTRPGNPNVFYAHNLKVRS
jgi:uncharacterized paraquat-inducible protein A